MAIINQLDNLASVVYHGSTINSNIVTTLLLLPPTIVKEVDKLTAASGDIITYTITITNLGHPPINNLPFTDTLPPGSTFVTGSFTVNGSAATPTLVASVLTYTIPTIAALGTAIIQFQVAVI